MRLTLRNMLAYMDNLLDSEASRGIAKKIEESEFASGLLHRIRDVMRQIRLGAPSVMDREGGLDPNTMAEYIDTTLPTDRVGDFEKICLESDIHLAEVACCHQVLALVLGEPAEVDSSVREHMYQLPESLAESGEEPSEKATEPPPLERGEAPVHKLGLPPKVKPSVPDYLQASRRKRRLWPVAGIATALLLGIALLWAMGQFKSGSFALRMLGLDSTEDQVDQSLAMSSKPEPTIPAGDPDSPNADPNTESPENDQLLQPSETTGDFSAKSPAEKLQRPESGPAAPLPPDLATSIVPSVDSTPKVPGGTTAMNDGPIRPEPTDVASVGRKPGPVDNDSNANMPPPPVATPKVESSPQPRPPVDAGQVAGLFLDPDQVLLRFEADTGWRRLAVETRLALGDQLLSFPTFRPTVSLGGQVEITLIDGAQLQLPAGGEDPSAAGITLKYGRAVIKCTAEGGGALRLNAGDMTGIVTFGSAQSQLAVEVARRSGSTDDPETQPAPFVVTLYAASGECRWQAATGGEPVVMNPPARLVLDGQTAQVEPDAGGATWIVFDTTDSLDRLASARIEHGITVDSPVLLRLGELADDRRREVRWLALDCLARLGEFEQLVAMLDDPEQRLGWADYVQRLRAAVSRDPVTAARVRSEMERQHGPQGANLYEMLWGYGPRELNKEEAARLIGYLEHQTLAFRVLSFTTLYEITGLGFFYHPEDTAADRQRSIQRWKDRFKERSKPKAK
jgi:hypothetical protein